MSDFIGALMDRTPDGRRVWEVGYDLAIARERAMSDEAARMFGLDESRPFGHLAVEELAAEIENAEAEIARLDFESDRRREAEQRAARETEADRLWPGVAAWLGWEGIE